MSKKAPTRVLAFSTVTLALITQAFAIVSPAHAGRRPFPDAVGTWCGTVSTDFDQADIQIVIDQQRGGVIRGSWWDYWSSSGSSFQGTISGTVSRRGVVAAVLRAPGQGVLPTAARGFLLDGTIDGTCHEGRVTCDFAITNDPTACGP
jgi:hypothetical protein